VACERSANQNRGGENESQGQGVENKEQVMTTREVSDLLHVYAPHARPWTISAGQYKDSEAFLPTMPASRDMQSRDRAVHTALSCVASSKWF
jgi:hypothetical protein